MPHAPTAADSTAARQRAQQAAQGLTRKVFWSALLGGLVFAGLALYSDLPKMREAAARFEPTAFLSGLLLVATNYGLRIIRWNRYLHELAIQVPRTESALIFLSGFVMSVTPGKVGEVFKSLLLQQSRQISFVRSAPIVIAERLTDLIALVLLIALGSLALPGGPLIALLGATIVGSMVWVLSHRRLMEHLLQLGGRIRPIQGLVQRLGEAYESLHRLTRPGPMLMGTTLAFLAWGLECGTLYLIAHGFGPVDLSPVEAIFTYATSTIAGALAMMPGGLGVTEAGMAGLLHTLGAPNMTPAIASATTIMVRVATLWFAVVVGGVALAYYRLQTLPRTSSTRANSQRAS